MTNQQPAAVVEALTHYADTLCEGWCEGAAEFAKFDDCGGCLARRTVAALAATPAPDGREDAADLIRDSLYHLRADDWAKQYHQRAEAWLAALPNKDQTP